MGVMLGFTHCFIYYWKHIYIVHFKTNLSYSIHKTTPTTGNIAPAVTTSAFIGADTTNTQPEIPNLDDFKPSNAALPHQYFVYEQQEPAPTYPNYTAKRAGSEEIPQLRLGRRGQIFPIFPPSPQDQCYSHHQRTNSRMWHIISAAI